MVGAPRAMGQGHQEYSTPLKVCEAAIRDGDADVFGAAFAQLLQAEAPLDVAEVLIESLRSRLQDAKERETWLSVLEAAGSVAPRICRYTSNLLAGLGDHKSALAFSCLATDGLPDNAEYATHAGAICCVLGEYRLATRYLLRGLRLSKRDPVIHLHLSHCCAGQQRFDRALIFASRAVALAPKDVSFRLHWANLALRAGRPELVREAFQNVIESHVTVPDVHLLQSVAHQRLERWEEALEVATEGLRHWPSNIGLLMQRGTVLGLLARYKEAAEAFQLVLAIDAGNTDAKRALFAVLTEGGFLSEAASVGGALLAQFPNDRALGETLHFVLKRRFVDGASGATLTRDRGGPTHQSVRVGGSKQNSIGLGLFLTQMRIIVALMRREMRTRFGRTRLGYAWALLEPAIHVTILTSVIGLTIKGIAPLGDSYALLYFTGVMPYQLFLHTSAQVAAAVPANRSLLQIPLVTTFDVVASRALLELLTQVTVGTLLFLAFLTFEVARLPSDTMSIVQAVLLIWALAVGIGVLNSVVSCFVHAWERLWVAFLAILYFTSGIFYLPVSMPVWIRDMLKWNPLLQGIELFRTGFFANYEPFWLDRTYLVVCAIGALTLALGLERSFRRYLLSNY